MNCMDEIKKKLKCMDERLKGNGGPQFKNKNNAN